MTTVRQAARPVVSGNRFNKHESRDPVVRWFMDGFERSMFDMLGRIGPVRSVLEVGCGEGYVTAALARFFPAARVLGTDVSPEIIEVARRNHRRLAFEVCCIHDTPALGAWDLVVACEVFEHLENPGHALGAVGESARGHLLATVPREPLWRVLNLLRGHYCRSLGNTDGHIQHWSRGSFQRFVATRFEILQTRSPLPWTQVLARPRAVSAS